MSDYSWLDRVHASRSSQSPSRADRMRTANQKRFLTMFAQVGTIREACVTARVGRRTVYNWVRGDPDFAQRFESGKSHVVVHVSYDANMNPPEDGGRARQSPRPRSPSRHSPPAAGRRGSVAAASPVGLVQACEIRHDSGRDWDVLVLEDSEPLLWRRCVDEPEALYVAAVFKQDNLRGGWTEEGESHRTGRVAPKQAHP